MWASQSETKEIDIGEFTASRTVRQRQSSSVLQGEVNGLSFLTITGVTRMGSGGALYMCAAGSIDECAIMKINIYQPFIYQFS